MKVKELFEEILEEEDKQKIRKEIERLEQKILDLEDEKKEMPALTVKQTIEGEIKDVEERIKNLKKHLKESTLSEMAADEKSRRIKTLQDQLSSVTDELRNIDAKDVTGRQRVTNKRFEIQKQLNTLRQIEVTK